MISRYSRSHGEREWQQISDAYLNPRARASMDETLRIYSASLTFPQRDHDPRNLTRTRLSSQGSPYGDHSSQVSYPEYQYPQVPYLDDDSSQRSSQEDRSSRGRCERDFSEGRRPDLRRIQSGEGITTEQHLERPRHYALIAQNGYDCRDGRDRERHLERPRHNAEIVPLGHDRPDSPDSERSLPTIKIRVIRQSDIKKKLYYVRDRKSKDGKKKGIEALCYEELP